MEKKKKPIPTSLFRLFCIDEKSILCNYTTKKERYSRGMKALECPFKEFDQIFGHNGLALLMAGTFNTDIPLPSTLFPTSLRALSTSDHPTIQIPLVRDQSSCISCGTLIIQCYFCNIPVT